MKKIVVLLIVLSTGFTSCKKDQAPATIATESITLESAAVIAAGNLSFSLKTNTGIAKVYRQGDGKYVLALEKMNLDAGASVVVYLSQSKTVSFPYIKIFSANNLYGNIFHILPADIDVALFKYVVIQTETSEEIVASAELN